MRLLEYHYATMIEVLYKRQLSGPLIIMAIVSYDNKTIIMLSTVMIASCIP